MKPFPQSTSLSLILFTILWKWPCTASFALTTKNVKNCAASPTNGVARYYANDNSPFDETQASSIAPLRQRQDWIDRSLQYYTKVSREERRRRIGQAKDFDTPEYQDTFTVLAKKHYFALRKIKDGKPQHAEQIYRRIINELARDEDCDHAKLAVTTLLLALLLQRTGDAKQTRSVFLHFFRVAILEKDEEATECACSAKVLQAYALFEMKQGNSFKSLQLVNKAVALDPTLQPVLNWKQFRDVLERQSGI